MNGTLQNGCQDREFPSQQYLQMKPEELEHQYTPSQWTNRNLTSEEIIKCHIGSITQASKDTKKCFSSTLDVPYGSQEKEKLDVFIPDSLPADCPIFLYIHGGYWQMLGRELSSFAAQPILKAGGGFVATGYTLTPEVSMREIVNQVQSAVKYVLHLAKQRGSKGVYLGGHSAGGHLAAMMFAVNLMDGDSEISLLKGAMLVSGVFDVRPLVGTTTNIPLRLTESTAWDVSPFHYLEEIKKYGANAEFKIAYGSSESSEFRRQSEEFHKALVDRGISSSLICVPNSDHFTVIEQLCDPDYQLTKEILSLMNLKDGGATTVKNK